VFQAVLSTWISPFARRACAGACGLEQCGQTCGRHRKSRSRSQEI